MSEDTIEISEKEWWQEGYEEGYKKGYEAGLQASEEDVWNTLAEKMAKEVTDSNYKKFIAGLRNFGFSIELIMNIMGLSIQRIKALL